ncbi:6606_t:CDS:2, partial [Funneliformis caledonium]
LEAINFLMAERNENPPTYDKTAFDTIPTGAVNVDGVVNPAMLRAHLALLAKFKALEQPNKQIDTRYLLRAQERYVLWLYLLGSKNFDERTMPIPPIDVCYIWHSHLLSPLRYYEDMRRIYDPKQTFPDFPLKRLHDIWEKNGGHVDPESERIW